MSAETDETLRSAVREILLRDWDPHDVARNEHAHNSYDPLIAPLLDLIRGAANEDRLVEFLHERELESMCFPGLDTRRLRPVARKLLALRDL